MMTIPDYRIIAELHKESNKSLVRAVDQTTGKNVILKIIPFTGIVDSHYKEIDQEFSFGSGFTFSRISNYHRMLRPENYLVLEMDDFEGCRLEDYLVENKPSVQAALRIALALTQIVEELHHHGISHPDLRPAHFLINPETFEVRLADLTCAVAEDRPDE